MDFSNFFPSDFFVVALVKRLSVRKTQKRDKNFKFNVLRGTGPCV
jgi:hypothetical protein